MSKLVQLILAFQCLHESRSFYKRESNYKGFQRIKSWFEDLTGNIIFCCILAYGIFKGWIMIPTVLGDGYDYDSFDRCACNAGLNDSFIKL